MRFSANALCELEDLLDMGVNAVAAQLSNVESLRLKTVRAIFWAGLRDRHPKITLQQAGELVTEITLPRAMEMIGTAFQLAFQDTPKARPPKPGSVVPAKTEPEPELDGTGLHS
jgi:hypothetical protein